MGKKWVCLLKSVGKVESNKVFYRAVEEEEGGEKLVEMEMIISNQGVDYVGKPPSFIDKFLNNKVRPSRSGAMTAISTARRSLYSAPIAVTIAA
ncbi:hypothetical protein L249_3865 [Ophiocordyceps polyrhachis-furcata BCC 54312]|uniref:Uncharacterized protein n=1 Tax=Ophiocordyceps polyrhachis-furcata BCC 54312 TaxID=1330021 RepID=A0A367L623_9HYPO|nr:hypothetical protein L249_3865 [Ophiocordyceps polyrhachis-furcata BCC 54312]